MTGNSAEFNRNNNFNLIRIYLSLSVVLFHCYELSRQPSLAFVNRFFNGDTAVKAFFIISGYLVMKSYFRSGSIKEFWIKRMRRIYPAYFAVVVLSGLLGWLVSTYPIRTYFSSFELYRYLASNLVFLNFIQPTLPGVFENNFFTAVNGALWTIKIEVGYYLFVPLIYFLSKKMNRLLLYPLLFLSSLVFHLLMLHLYHTRGTEKFLFLSRQIPGLLFYFILGAWVIELESRRWFKVFVTWMCIPSMVALCFPVGIVLQCALLVSAIFSFAYWVPQIKYSFRQEDISYGLYIYHFPVIQLLIDHQVFNISPVLGVLLSVLITAFLATFSWLIVEKPNISKKINRNLALN